jgi:hypothetical protein
MRSRRKITSLEGLDDLGVVIPSEAQRSRGCNAADEVRKARLSIPRR